MRILKEQQTEMSKWPRIEMVGRRKREILVTRQWKKAKWELMGVWKG